MKLKNYTPVEVEILYVHANDVITSSPNADGDITNDDIFD